MLKDVHPGVKHATHVGLKAFHGFKTAHEPAKQVARVPVVGPALGLALLLGATVAGAIQGITDFEE